MLIICKVEYLDILQMPTVLLLDVSLSMSQPVTMADCSEEYQLRHLAVHGLNTLLDLSAEHSKLEFFSLVSELLE